MQKIKFLFPFILFILIALMWLFFKKEKPIDTFSYSLVNTINLQIDPDNFKAIFKKYSSGQGKGIFTLNKGEKEEAIIHLGGDSSKDTFYETEKTEAMTLQFSTSSGFTGKVKPLYGDNSYSREHLAYMVYESFFGLVPTNNFVKISINDQAEKLFLMVENLSSDFLLKRKLQKLYTKSQGEDVRFLINSKAYNLIINKFDNKFLFEYLLFIYLVDDQDGPFADRGHTENATLYQDKFFHKYIFIPNDLDQVFECFQNDLHKNILSLTSYMLQHSSKKIELKEILRKKQKIVVDEKLLENLESDIHDKLSDCCSNFMNKDYFEARKELLSKLACQKQKFYDLTSDLLLL